MAMLQIIYGYQKIFKEQAEPFEKIDEEATEIAELMLNTLYHEGAVGLGANMVGVLKRIIVVDLFENKQKNPIVAFNPEITFWSEETQIIDEASYSFPGISVPIERPKEIKFNYLNLEGERVESEASGFLATVIQHEMDYLDGITIFDHVSKMKRDLLIKKMEKQLKLHPPHVHSSSCNH